MTAREALPGLLKSFVRYYDIKEEGVQPPFAAEAEFHSHEEQFFLVKQAKLSEAESKEFVFFAVSEHLTLDEIRMLDETAWQAGISRVFPHDGHRNSDVVLIVLADKVDADAAAYIKKLKRYESYKHTLHGWSHYRVIVRDMSTEKLAFNRMGRTLKNVLSKINL
ncbi:MAG: hypothetical protein IJB73_06695 [Firmicutes bacterium]|nr:hypothetical protein [Bacillota bacterium]